MYESLFSYLLMAIVVEGILPVFGFWLQRYDILIVKKCTILHNKMDDSTLLLMYEET